MEDEKYHYVRLSEKEIEVVLQALDIFNIDMNNVATVCGDPESLEEAEISERLMNEIETYLEGPEDNEE